MIQMAASFVFEKASKGWKSKGEDTPQKPGDSRLSIIIADFLKGICLIDEGYVKHFVALDRSGKDFYNYYKELQKYGWEKETENDNTKF